MTGRRRNNAKRNLLVRTGLRRHVVAQRQSPVTRTSGPPVNAPSRSPNETVHYVDLTCEDQYDNDQYVDLTVADVSTVIIPSTPTTPHPIHIHDLDVAHAANFTSPLLLSESSDSDSELPPLPFNIMRVDPSSSTGPVGATSPTTSIVCPVCLDGVTDIKGNGRQVMSTNCGHIFCSECIRGILTNRDSGSRCPTCRKKLSVRSVHPLFI